MDDDLILYEDDLRCAAGMLRALCAAINRAEDPTVVKKAKVRKAYLLVTIKAARAAGYEVPGLNPNDLIEKD